MGNPYTSQSASGYNSNPPADDGSAVSTNQTTWASVKTKLGDPVKTLADGINGAVNTAFQKIVGGAGVVSYSTDSTVQSSDQGKLVRATSSGITITTPDASTVGSPFVFAFVNSSSGTVTFKGNGSQTVDGNATVSVSAGAGFMVYTDGTNWFTTGKQGILTGAQMRPGDILNGTIVESNGTNAVTFALKTLAGNDPSATDPVLICFRNATAGTGNYVYRTVTSATSLTISAGSTMGFTSNVAGRLWITLVDNAGTVLIGAINCLSGTNIYPLGQFPLVSTTAEGGAGGADSAQVMYASSSVSNKAYNVYGYADYYGASVISTAGNWNVSPLRIQLYGDGVKLPGDVVQAQGNVTGAVSTGTTNIPQDDTIPQDTEGTQFLSQSITPTSAVNVLDIDAQLVVSVGSSISVGAALFSDQDGTANALTAVNQGCTTGLYALLHLWWPMQAGTTSATAFTARAGLVGGATVTVNGLTASRQFGGAFNSFIRVRELMA